MQFGIADRMRVWATCRQAVHDVGLVVPRIGAQLRPAARREMDAAADLHTAQAYQLRSLIHLEDGTNPCRAWLCRETIIQELLATETFVHAGFGGLVGNGVFGASQGIACYHAETLSSGGDVGSSAFVILMAKPTAGKGSSVFL